LKWADKPYQPVSEVKAAVVPFSECHLKHVIQWAIHCLAVVLIPTIDALELESEALLDGR
jgi:hypothetical protein